MRCWYCCERITKVSHLKSQSGGERRRNPGGRRVGESLAVQGRTVSFKRSSSDNLFLISTLILPESVNAPQHTFGDKQAKRECLTVRCQENVNNLHTRPRAVLPETLQGSIPRGYGVASIPCRRLWASGASASRYKQPRTSGSSGHCWQNVSIRAGRRSIVLC